MKIRPLDRYIELFQLTWRVNYRGRITKEVEKLIDEGELPIIQKFWKAGQEEELVSQKSIPYLSRIPILSTSLIKFFVTNYVFIISNLFQFHFFRTKISLPHSFQ